MCVVCVVCRVDWVCGHCVPAGVSLLLFLQVNPILRHIQGQIWTAAKRSKQTKQLTCFSLQKYNANTSYHPVIVGENKYHHPILILHLRLYSSLVNTSNVLLILISQQGTGRKGEKLSSVANLIPHLLPTSQGTPFPSRRCLFFLLLVPRR